MYHLYCQCMQEEVVGGKKASGNGSSIRQIVSISTAIKKSHSELSALVSTGRVPSLGSSRIQKENTLPGRGWLVPRAKPG